MAGKRDVEDSWLGEEELDARKVGLGSPGPLLGSRNWEDMENNYTGQDGRRGTGVTMETASTGNRIIYSRYSSKGCCEETERANAVK